MTNSKTNNKLYIDSFILYGYGTKEEDMEELLTKIGELVATEIDDVKDVEYVDKEMGYMFYITLKDGKKVLLSLIDAKL